MAATSPTVRAQISPAALAWVRTVGGFTPAEVALKIDASEDRVIAWESGVEQPTVSQLAKLAASVRRPIAVFYLRECDLPREPADLPDMRCAPGAGTGRFTPELRTEVRRARYAARRFSEAAPSLGLSFACRLPRLSVGDDLDAAAAAVRSALGVTLAGQAGASANASLNAWRDALFDAGVLSRQFVENIEDTRGFALHEAGIAVVAVSPKRAPSSRLFTLIHEVGHICLGKDAVSDSEESDRLLHASSPHRHVERFCDALSGAVLLPSGERDVVAALRNVSTDPDLVTDQASACGRRFGVSKYVVLRRMLSLGLLDRDPFFAIQSQWLDQDAKANQDKPKAKPDGGPNYYAGAVARVGRRLSIAVGEALDNGAISHSDASSLLGVKVGQVQKLIDFAYGVHRGK